MKIQTHLPSRPSSLYDRVQAYLRALRLPDILIGRLIEDMWKDEGTAVQGGGLSEQAALNRNMDRMHAVLQENHFTADDQMDVLFESEENLLPPVRRSPMAYRPVERQRSILEKTNPSLAGKIAAAKIQRRTVYGIVMALGVVYAGTSMATILMPDGVTRLETAIIWTYTILFAWITTNFLTVLWGFIALMMGGDDLAVEKTVNFETAGISGDTRVAVVMPVYNENVERVFAGIQAMCESLDQTAHAHHFHFFILSDSSDPGQWVEEEAAWIELCRRVNGFGRVFYRHRKVRLHKKSGNISDFCRRWGSQYTYMLPLDADSLMSGETLVRMTKVMESRPDIGIFQTAPKGINQKTLLSRVQQFASHLYGPLLLAGQHVWQLDEATFWGHNAIVRMEPFIRYGALPHLADNLPFGGEILSHDFVEAALVRRAGYGVWLSYDMEESYEELPPNLLAELERDRRWCRGNIQHLRLLFMKGIAFGHRMTFINGNMFYLSSLLWLVSLLMITAYAIIDAFHEPVYFSSQPSLFPHWPVQHQPLSTTLLWVTIAFLFLPKMMSMFWACRSTEARLSMGGVLGMGASVLFESLSSIFLAPIKMLYHSWFYILALFGRKNEWKRQNREATKLTAWESIRAHWLGGAGAVLLAVIIWAVNPSLFVWMLMIIVPLMVAVPVSVLLSYPELGALLEKWHMLIAPVEVAPPDVLKRLHRIRTAGAGRRTVLTVASGRGFMEAVADPMICAMHLRLLGTRYASLNTVSFNRPEHVWPPVDVSAFTSKEQMCILRDPIRFFQLHGNVWRCPDPAYFLKWSAFLDET